MKKVLCGVLLLAVLACFAPAALADVDFWVQHRSEGWLVSDKADYTHAEFDGVSLGLEQSGDNEPQERQLTITGGAYSYRYQGRLVEVDNTSSSAKETFALKWVEEDKEYVPVNQDNEEFAFQGKADTGLNGVTVSWTGNPAGSATLPNFTSTAVQLATAVPYVTLTRDSSKNVTGFTVRMVKASDPTTPVAVENVQLQVRVGQNGSWKQRTWTDTGKNWKAYNGSDLPNTLATPIPAAEFTGVDVRVRINGDTTHRWRFYPVDKTNLEFWTRHESKACLINDVPNYNTADFKRVAMGLEKEGIAANKLHMNARGTLTVNGSFSYNSEKDGKKTITNGSANFDLVPTVKEGEELQYGLPGNVEAFKGAADTGGMNGKMVSWTFGGAANLQDGEATLPNFISTKDQLASAAPYVTLKRNGSNAVTGFTVSLVNPKSGNPTTPVAVEGARLRVGFGRKGQWSSNKWTDTGKKDKDYAGVALSDTLASPIPAAEFTGIEVRVKLKKEGTHLWRFLQTTVTDEGITFTPPSGKSITTGTDKNTIALTAGDKITVTAKDGNTIDYCLAENRSLVLRAEGSGSGTWTIIADQAGTETARVLYFYNDKDTGQVNCISKPLEITVTGEKTDEQKAADVVEDLEGDAKKAMEEALKGEDKEAAQDVAASLNDSLSQREIASLSEEEITFAIFNKTEESADAVVEATKGVENTTKPAGTDLLKKSSNDSLKAAQNLSVKPKVVTPVAVNSTKAAEMQKTFQTFANTGQSDVDVELVKAASGNLQTNIEIEPASGSLETQLEQLETLLTQIAETLVKAVNPKTQNKGMVVATSLPTMKPKVAGFFPMSVNLRNLTPGRKLMFWPSVEFFNAYVARQQSALAGGVSLADVSVADSKEGQFFFLDSAGNPVSTVSGDASDMYVVPYLEKDGNYSTAFITADATADDKTELQALAEAANPGNNPDSNPGSEKSPTSDKSSGGCDAGFGLAGMLALAAGLLTLRKK